MPGEAEKGHNTVKLKKKPWPRAMAEQAKAVRRTLELLEAPANVETVAKCFTRAKRDRVAELLETLASLGQARALPGGIFEAA